MTMAEKDIKIIVFTEGTILMRRNGVGHSREEIVQQVKDDDESLHDFRSYVPIGDSAEKLIKWESQGAEIVYLTSRTEPDEIDDIGQVLEEHGFPAGELVIRQENEEYRDVVERIIPDVLVEDDCESIGGADEMTITHVSPEIRRRIKSVVVEEFGGIDHLPDRVEELLSL